MSTICITHLAVLCNYAPCSDTCIVLHVNSIRVIRVPYEYTVNWQQIPLFNFQSFRNYRRNHNGFFLLFSLSFFLFPNDRARQIPKQLFLGQYLLNRKRRARKKKKKIKGRSDQGEICGSCLPVLCAHDWIWGRLQATRRLWEIKEVPCFALHTSNTINNAFSCPTCRAQWPECAHTHAHTLYKGLQQCLAFDYTVCWVQEQRWVQVDSYLGASEGCWRKVRILVEMHFNKTWLSNQQVISLWPMLSTSLYTQMGIKLHIVNSFRWAQGFTQTIDEFLFILFIAVFDLTHFPVWSWMIQ